LDDFKYLNNAREIISNSKDNDTARWTILALIEIEKLDRHPFMMMAGEIRGAARDLKPKKRRRAYLTVVK